MMSELIKLQLEFTQKDEKRRIKTLKEFYLAVGKLQHDCKHKKTHWIQELSKNGSFKEDELYKRCYVCGSTIETLKVTGAQREMFLNNFDADVEQQKALNVPITMEAKE